MDKSEIGKKIRELDRGRRLKIAELIAEYDRTIYQPSRKELVEACEAIGHTKGKFHDNGVGWAWWYCSTCGASFNTVKLA